MPDTTYPTVTPYLVVDDADALVRFLKTVFDAKEQSLDRRPDGTIGHAEMNVGDSLVMVGQAGGEWKARSAALYLWVDDVDATYKRALDAGGRSESKPEDKPYGHRTAGVDMSGVTWWLGAPVRVAK
jgi:PhnB protein